MNKIKVDLFCFCSYLKLYTSMPIEKLARFVDVPEDVLLQHLYTYKVNDFKLHTDFDW